MDPREVVRVVYVMGSAKSGSTVLDIVLGNHPEVVAVGELASFSRHGWLTTQYCACGERCGDCGFWSEVRRQWILLVGEAAVDRYPRWQDAFERIRRLPRLLLERANPSAEFREYAEATAALFASIRTVSGRTIVVDSSKDPGRAFALAALPGLDVRLIHLVRDGRGVVFSLQQGVRKNPRLGIHNDFVPRPVWYTTLQWGFINICAGWVRRQVPVHRSILLRYEDIVGAPHAAFGRVGDFLHVNLDTVADAVSRGEHMRIEHTVAGNPIRMSGSLQVQLDGRWTSGLSRKDGRVVHAIAGWLLRRYGYLV